MSFWDDPQVLTALSSVPSKSLTAALFQTLQRCRGAHR